MSNIEEQPIQGLAGGQLNAALCNLVVRLFAEYTGRGPTRARTLRAGPVITVVAQDMMTKAERNLVDRGEADTVVHLRRKFQSTMREDLVAGVELLTGRRVVSFMSDHDAKADICAETFILDAPVEEPAESARD